VDEDDFGMNCGASSKAEVVDVDDCCSLIGFSSPELV